MADIIQPSDNPILTSQVGKQYQQTEVPERSFVGFNKIIGVDSSSSRLDIPETKAYYLENVMPVGDSKLRVVPNIGPMLYNFAEPCYAAKSLNINSAEKIVAFGNSGKVYLYDVTTNRSIVINQNTPLSGVGSWCDQWNNSDILFIDSTGYYDYNITNGFTKLAGTGAPPNGDTICVFQNRVWITSQKLLLFSGAGGFDDGSISGTNYWLPANGSGFSVLVDPSIRSGITRMFQSNGLLYLYHSSGVNVISNVQVPIGSNPPTPIFSNSNIQAAIGTDQPYSVVGYSTYNLFVSRQGAYMMYGLSAPQLSEDMIGTWQYLNFDKPISAAQCVVFQQLCAAFLLNRKGDPNIPDATVVALWFKRANADRWFFCNFGNLTFILNSWINGVPTLFGLIPDANGYSQLFRLFVGGTPPDTLVKTKLWTLEDPTQRKELLRGGMFIDVVIPGSAISLAVDDENGSSELVNAIPGSVEGQIGTFLMNGGCPPLNSRSIGMTLTTTGYDYNLHWVGFDYKLRQRWGLPEV